VLTFLVLLLFLGFVLAALPVLILLALIGFLLAGMAAAIGVLVWLVLAVLGAAASALTRPAPR
jgi:hypothetical protein